MAAPSFSLLICFSKIQKRSSCNELGDHRRRVCLSLSLPPPWLRGLTSSSTLILEVSGSMAGITSKFRLRFFFVAIARRGGRGSSWWIWWNPRYLDAGFGRKEEDVIPFVEILPVACKSSVLLLFFVCFVVLLIQKFVSSTNAFGPAARSSYSTK